MFRSIVRNASKRPVARRSSSPFCTPSQPSPITVSTSCPKSVVARSTGRFSSNRTRTRQQGVARDVQRGNGLLALDRRELPQELIKRLAALEIIKQRLDRDSSADEDRCAPEDVGVTVNDGSSSRHGSLSIHRTSVVCLTARALAAAR